MRSDTSWTTLFVPAILMYTIGLLMVYDASSGELVDLASSKSEYGPFIRQCIWGFVSFASAYFLYRIGWQGVVRHAWKIYALLLVLLIGVFIPGLGIQANGARRWIGLFGFSLQPSEFVKLFLPAVYLRYLADHEESVRGSFRGFLSMLFFLMLPIGCIVLQPNNGTAGVISLIVGLLIILTKIPWKYWLIPIAILSLCLGAFAWNSSYVQSRIQAYKNPEKDIRGKGHQPYQAKIAAGSGGLFGVGPAKSMQKLSYLPEAQNDYIAAIYAEEFGFAGIVVLISLYGWLIFAMAQHVAKAESAGSFCWGMVMMFLVFIQTFLNLGVVSGLLPTTGLNLPFFSQGGSSLVVNVSALGLLASMSKRSALCAQNL